MQDQARLASAAAVLVLVLVLRHPGIVNDQLAPAAEALHHLLPGLSSSFFSEQRVDIVGVGAPYWRMFCYGAVPITPSLPPPPPPRGQKECFPVKFWNSANERSMAKASFAQ
ncbi:uncharacterized protein B0T15DRAFT_509689 [Chaetomium strumarium]|uniref:Uncharacterized protein n=1 Tax=Chaetomium strumarium TaxID=1170767 RepID=A0AAJ0M293_9PEZI|nr:hypothetical protein B0T15DRAFT_509689 [Chaetomium strumarium]